MWIRTTIAFLAAVGICLPAAVYRFKDSGHAVGLLSAKGGSVRHAVELDPGRRRYVVIVSGTVLPPYRGNARVVVEGQPEMDYEIHRSGPVLDLGMRRKPVFHDGVLAGLKPKDRFTLWVVMRPRKADWSSEGQTPAFQNSVTFRDTETGKTLLQVPVAYQPKEETCHAEQD